MASAVVADYTVEAGIGAVTDWVLTMPTKRQHVTTDSATLPFQGRLTASGACEPVGNDPYVVRPMTFDREGPLFGPGTVAAVPPAGNLCATANVATFRPAGVASPSTPLQSVDFRHVALSSQWINGFARLALYSDDQPNVHVVPAPSGATTILNTRTGAITNAASVTYFGLPVVGFAARSYSNGTLLVDGSPVLSNYGAVFQYKYERRIEVAG